MDRNFRLRAIAAALATSACAVMLGIPSTQADASPASEAVWWRETFNGPPRDFVDPFGHDALMLARVYSVGHDDSGVLHARHDGDRGAVPAMHYGKVFAVGRPRLEHIRALRWRWRVLRQPAVDHDAWADLAASVYVVVREPSLVRGGRGFKLGWVAKPAAEATHQHGLLQIALQAGSPLGEWRSESVDLCALYRRDYGPCEGEHVLYVGVMTDADTTHSVAEAEYDDFELLIAP